MTLFESANIVASLSVDYTGNYTNEVFVVTDVLETTPFTYKIADIRNADKIIGTFYEEELSLFKPTDVKQI